MSIEQEKINKKKSSLSPAGGGSSSIQRKFQTGVDKKRSIELLQYKSATQQTVIRITEADKIKINCNNVYAE